MNGAAYFVTEPKITERDGIFQVELASGDATITLAMTPHALRLLSEGGRVELNRFQDQQAGKVTPFKTERSDK